MNPAGKVLTYAFDPPGQRSSLIAAEAGRFTYFYDAAGRIEHLVNPQADRTTYTYDATDRRLARYLANGTRTSFTYNNASQILTVAHLSTTGTYLASFDYTYDSAGLRTSVLELDASRVTWTYDATNQLTAEHRTGTTPFRQTFTYDPLGNRLIKDFDGTRTTATYDLANQLMYLELPAGRTTYTFDASGNQAIVLDPTGDRTTTTWDFENLPTLVQLPTTVRNTATYNADGLRTRLDDSSGTTKFVWDDQQYLLDTDASDLLVATYTNHPGQYTDLITQRRGTTTSTPHFDALGSTRHITNALGQITDTLLYDAWGQQLTHTGSTNFPFHYVGQHGYYTDTDTQSIYILARTYQPTIARWWSIDPKQDCSDICLYKYSFNSPSITIDPSGEEPPDCCCWRTVPVDFVVPKFVTYPFVAGDFIKAINNIWSACCIRAKLNFVNRNNQELQSEVISYRNGIMEVVSPGATLNGVTIPIPTPLETFVTQFQDRRAVSVYLVTGINSFEPGKAGPQKVLGRAYPFLFPGGGNFFSYPAPPALAIFLAMDNGKLLPTSGRTLAHEMGHILGLGHVLAGPDLMRLAGGNNDINISTQECDLARTVFDALFFQFSFHDLTSESLCYN